MSMENFVVDYFVFKLTWVF